MNFPSLRFMAPLAAALTLSRCTTDVCACSPRVASAVLYGRVISPTAEPVPGALVRAYSAPAEGCHADGGGLDYGNTSARADGTFSMGLPGAGARDSICVFVFAMPASESDGWTVSDTALVLLRFSYDEPQDSARVDLALRVP